MSEQPRETEPATWRTWSPPFAPHVRGRYERRTFDSEAGMPNPQRVAMECTRCGNTWRTVCASGQVRGHIAKFARLHLHRDVLDPAEDPAMRAKRAEILERREARAKSNNKA